MAGAGGSGPASTNVSADNLGAVIKILSRWEVNRKDFHKTLAPSALTSSGRSLISLSFIYFFFSFIFGGIGRKYQKGLR